MGDPSAGSGRPTRTRKQTVAFTATEALRDKTVRQTGKKRSQTRHSRPTSRLPSNRFARERTRLPPRTAQCDSDGAASTSAWPRGWGMRAAALACGCTRAPLSATALAPPAPTRGRTAGECVQRRLPVAARAPR